MRRRHWFVVSICALAVMLAGAPHSFGAGFALYEGSARGNALGNLAGSADDPSAMFMNPAGITQLPGLQVMAGATVISPMVDVQTTNPYGGNGNTESGERNYWIPPHLYASYQFNDSVWFGLATYSRFGLGTEFDDDWWGRYNNYNAVVQTLSFNPNVALKLNDMVSIAGGMEIMWFDLNLESKIDAGRFLGIPGYQVNNPETTTFDIDNCLEGDSFGYGFNFAIHVKPSDQVAFGAGYRSQVKQHVDGDADFTREGVGTGSVPAAWFNDTGAEGTITLPDMLFLGVAYRPVERLLLQAGAIWTRWSTFDELTISYDDPIVIIPPNAALPTGLVLGEVSKPKDWDDVWRLSIGAEFKATDWLDLRASYIFDESPIPDSTVDYLVPADDRHLFGFGTGFHWNDWTLDLSYTYLMLEDRDVDARVADGIYEGEFENGDAHLIGFSLSYKF